MCIFASKIQTSRKQQYEIGQNFIGFGHNDMWHFIRNGPKPNHL